ncbi:MAG: hypothetical protein NTV34_11575 [Proteobacteria bacterium]|nr:hypothetical protein [Pseudomonadota bacterium]
MQQKKQRPSELKIRSTFAAHDRTQLETVFDYPVVPTIRGRSKSQTYVVEAWFFYPAQMGVNPETYSKERFYSDLRPLVRFREPRFSFRDLMGLNGARSPLVSLQNYIRGIQEGKTSVTIQRAISEARIFGCTFASYFLKRINKRSKSLKRIHRYVATSFDENGDGAEALTHYIEETLELLSKGMYLLKELRKLLVEAESVQQEYLRPIVTELKLVDEYCTYRFRDGLSSLMLVATEMDPRLAPHVDYVRFLKRCVAMNRLERWYATGRGYAWIDEMSSDDEVERYMYRRGTLKRRLWSVLYLKIRSRPMFAFQRQLGAMAAAGMASLWWVVAMYFISMRGGAFIGGGGGGGGGGFNVQHFWESSGFLIVTASMVAYILKDRIKENGRNFFSGKLFNRIPDNSERILYEPPTEAPLDVGNITEYTKFIDPSDLPLEVKEIRQGSFVDELEADDSPKDVIHYRKVIELYPKAIAKIDYPIRAVHDILRINIASYLTRLDDPQAGTDVISSDGKMTSLKLPKVYHMDIILKHALANVGHKDREVVYDQFRLILNKRGIIRIDRI